MLVRLMRGRSVIARVIVLAAFTSLVAYGSESLAQVKLRVGYAVARDSHFGDGVDAFAKALARAAPGRFSVEHVPAGLAGGEAELMRSVSDGSIELSVISTGPVSNLVPEVRILDLPFLFYDYAHARRVLDGPIGRDLLDKFPARGLIALAWAEHGFRHLTNNRRPIVYPDDLKDLRIRTMENPVHMAAIKALKAQPQPLAFTKLLAALRAGELDGQENPVTVIMSSKIYESQKFLSLTGHFYSAGLILMSPQVWTKLSEADRAALKGAAQAAAIATRQRVGFDEIRAIDQLRQAGMQVNVFVDGPAFRRLLREQYKQFYPEVDRQMLEAIQSGL